MKYKMMFFAPNGNEGGESPGLNAFGPAVVADGPQAGDEEVRAQNELEQEGKEEKPTLEEDKTKVKKVEGAAPVVDAAALAREFGSVISEHFKKEEPVPAKKKYDDLSPEEAAKELELWEPTKEWQARYDDLETREAAVREMRDGMTRSADKISKLRIAELREELNETLTETRNYLRDMQNQAAEERLAKAYPDLAKPELQPIVKAVSKQLVADGAKFKSESELFDSLASSVEAVIRAGGAKDFKLSTGSNPANNKTKAKTNPNAIPVTTSGAGGQAGGRSQETEKPRALAIFDK